jgi:hypothetical protein
MTREFPTTIDQSSKRHSRLHDASIGSFGPWDLPWSLVPAHWAFHFRPDNDQGSGMPMTKEVPITTDQGKRHSTTPHDARIGSFGPWDLPWSLPPAHWAFHFCPDNDQGPGMPMTREFPTSIAQGTKRSTTPHDSRLGSFVTLVLPWSLVPAHWAFHFRPENDQGPTLPMTREFPTTIAQGTRRSTTPLGAHIGSFGPWDLPWSLVPAHWAFHFRPEKDQIPSLPTTREFPTTIAQGTKRSTTPLGAHIGSFGPWDLPWSLVPAHWAFLLSPCMTMAPGSQVRRASLS